MEELKVKIAEHEQVIRSLHDEISNELLTVGQEVYREPPQDLNKELSDTRKRIEQLEETSEGYSSLVRRIQEISARREELKETIAAHRSSIRGIESDDESFFESIGESAYEAVRSDDSLKDRYSELFKDITAARDEIAALSDQIAENEAELEQKRFFDKVVVRGRLALLRGRQANKEGSLPRLFFRLGRDVVHSDFVQEVDSSDLKQSLEPYRRNQTEKKKLESEIAAAVAEDESLEAELEEAGATRKSAKRIVELERLQQECEQERAEAFKELGNRARESVRVDALTTVAKQALEQIRTAEDKINREREHIARLNAGIDAAELVEKVRNVDGEISDKNDTIKRLKNEVTQLKKRKSELESLRDAALERRGPEEEL